MQNNRLTGRGQSKGKLERVELSDDDDRRRFIWRLSGSESGTFTCYSPTFWGVRVHWDMKARRSMPHFKEGEECEGCKRNLPDKPLFYLFGMWIEKRKLVFVELTKTAAKALKDQLGAGETLRGAGLYLQRTAAKNGRLQVRMMNYDPLRDKLPRDEDPHDTLMALWSLFKGDKRGGREFPTGTGSNGFIEHKMVE